MDVVNRERVPVALKNPTEARIEHAQGESYIDQHAPYVNLIPVTATPKARQKVFRFTLHFSDVHGLTLERLKPRAVTVTGPHRCRQVAKLMTRTVTPDCKC